MRARRACFSQQNFLLARSEASDCRKIVSILVLNLYNRKHAITVITGKFE